MTTSKVAYTLDEAAEATGYSRRTIDSAVAKHDLIPRYANSRPVIPAKELERWLDSLPTENPRNRAAR